MAKEKRQEVSLDDYFYGAVTVGERGQVVIPAKARQECGVQPGDKLLVFRHPVHVGISLVKLDSVHALQEMMTAIVASILEHEEERADGR